MVSFSARITRLWFRKKAQNRLARLASLRSPSLPTLSGANGTTFARGSLIGAVCGLGFVVPPMFAQHISEKQPFKLFGINTLYWLIAMYLSGGVLAIWQ
jgi:hypothetical protein